MKILQTFHTFTFIKRIFLLLLLFAFTNQVEAQIYVNQNATGVNNGTSWTDAFTDLQPALAAATTGTQIYIAKGTYKPTQ